MTMTNLVLIIILQKIFVPFRMAGFCPFGVPVAAGMIAASTVPSTMVTVMHALCTAIMFFQWLNQTHNACVNYCNRPINKGQKMAANEVYTIPFSGSAFSV